jgi:hypothetical protein
MVIGSDKYELHFGTVIFVIGPMWLCGILVMD